MRKTLLPLTLNNQILFINFCIKYILWSLDFFDFTQISSSIDFRGELLNLFRKRWSFALTQHEKRNEAPKLYEVGVESPAIGIAAEDEGG